LHVSLCCFVYYFSFFLSLSLFLQVYLPLSSGLNPIAVKISLHSISIEIFREGLQQYWGSAVAQRLRCCSTNRKFVGSIPAGLTKIPSNRTIILGLISTSDRTEYQQYLLGVKAAGA
jgi:hypothetical protein